MFDCKNCSKFNELKNKCNLFNKSIKNISRKKCFGYPYNNMEKITIEKQVSLFTDRGVK